jgi:hypothetical protein
MPFQKSLWGFAGLSSVAFRMLCITGWMLTLSMSSPVFTRGALQADGAAGYEV